MKLFVKSLKGNHFQIQVNPHDTVGDVKKNIESVQGANVYPASKQMIIYQGRVLTNGTTLEEYKVSENSFIVVMLCKSKIFSEESSAAASAIPTSRSKSSSVGNSVAAATAMPTPKCNNSSGDSSVPAAAVPTSKIKKSGGESSVAAETLSKSKSKSSSGDSSRAAAAMPVSKSKISSEKCSVEADPIPTSNSKSSSGKSSAAAADMPVPKSTSSSGDSSVAATAMPTAKTKKSSRKSSVAAARMPTSNSKSSLGDNSVAAAAMPISMAPAKPEPPSIEAPTTPAISVTNASVPASVSTSVPSPITASSAPASVSTSVPSPITASSVPASVSTSVPSPITASSVSGPEVGGEAASNLAAGNGLKNTIQHILDMGGGIWDRDTVVRALHAAFNNPERAVEYLCSGVPEQAEAGKAASASTVSQQPTQSATVPSSRSNAHPLNIFPQGLPTEGSNAPLSGPLDFLRNSEQFQALRAMVQANPETLQPMLQEFGRKNPNLMRLIQEHKADFQQLLNEPVAGEHGNILEQFSAAMPQSIQVTRGEHKAIERLEAMGFDRSTVLEAYFACNKNEELTANYLLDHMHEFEE